eukprot:SAG31_NODE_828_length_11716_cov_4.405785_8_plen_50_part_00
MSGLAHEWDSNMDPCNVVLLESLCNTRIIITSVQRLCDVHVLNFKFSAV